jgi:hypothetical protein
MLLRLTVEQNFFYPIIYAYIIILIGGEAYLLLYISGGTDVSKRMDNIL